MLACRTILHERGARREKIIKPNKITIFGPRKLSAADTISLNVSEGMEERELLTLDMIHFQMAAQSDVEYGFHNGLASRNSFSMDCEKYENSRENIFQELSYKLK